MDALAFDSKSSTSLSACGYGSGRISTACTTLKTAVVAPTPSASVNVAVIVMIGVRRRLRQACRTSWRSIEKCSVINNQHSAFI